MSSGSGILTALAGAVTTGILGNYLVQRWQRRSWFAQQRQLFHQQELDELKQLYDRLTEKAEGRLMAMRRLLANIDAAPAELDDALAEYRTQLVIWNTSLRSFYPTITLHYGWSTTTELESEIHGSFVALGRTLEGFVKLVRNGGAPTGSVKRALRSSLDAQGGRLSEFYQRLASGIEKRRDEVLNGRRHAYVSGAFHQFTVSDLIKALFTSNVDGFNVVRPT